MGALQISLRSVLAGSDGNDASEGNVYGADESPPSSVLIDHLYY